MANDFLGSIAQNNLNYSVSTTVVSVVGQNYYTPMIFLGSVTSAPTNLVTVPGSFPAIVNVTNANFATLTIGTLLTWLTSYFAVNNGLSSINIVVYDSTIASYGGLTTAYQAFKDRGYQKFMFEAGTLGAGKIALGQLCAADPLLSQFWSGTSDAGTLVNPQIAGLGYQLASAVPPVQCRLVYSAQAGIEPALTSLGLALSYVNATGTPVANGVDYNATTAVLASGTTGGSDNSNVTATGMANLKLNNIGYFETLGNNTGGVAIVGDQTTIGGYVGAQWFSQYLQYVSQVGGATYLTAAPRKNKNEPTYNGLIAILKNNAIPFASGNNPIISNFQLTNYPFISAPASAGNTFIITGPSGYAWSALFNRGLTYVTLTGSLTVQA